MQSKSNSESDLFHDKLETDWHIIEDIICIFQVREQTIWRTNYWQKYLWESQLVLLKEIRAGNICSNILHQKSKSALILMVPTVVCDPPLSSRMNLQGTSCSILITSSDAQGAKLGRMCPKHLQRKWELKKLCCTVHQLSCVNSGGGWETWYFSEAVNANISLDILALHILGQKELFGFSQKLHAV